MDDDVCSLSDSKCDNLRIVRLDGNKVIGDNGHIVTVNRELLDAFCASIDESQTVGLTGCEVERGNARIGHARCGVPSRSSNRTVEVVTALNEIVV